MEMLDNLKIRVKLELMKNRWRKKNKHNYTKLVSLCDINKITVGKYTYGNINAESFEVAESHLYIGNYCSIAQNVRFLLDGEHIYTNISTYPFKVRFFGSRSEALCKGPIIIQDDVWIGERSIILSGVTIGQGAIIGAGSIVAKNVPAYSIFAGGKVIKYRFEQKIINKLLQLDYSSINLTDIENNINLFYTDIELNLFESEFFNKHKKK